MIRAPPAAKAHIATVLEDLHAVAIELRLVLPAITARDGPGRYGHAGADEFREHSPKVRKADAGRCSKDACFNAPALLQNDRYGR